MEIYSTECARVSCAVALCSFGKLEIWIGRRGNEAFDISICRIIFNTLSLPLEVVPIHRTWAIMHCKHGRKCSQERCEYDVTSSS